MGRAGSAAFWRKQRQRNLPRLRGFVDPRLSETALVHTRPLRVAAPGELRANRKLAFSESSERDTMMTEMWIDPR
jgi:hypothetical protein